MHSTVLLAATLSLAAVPLAAVPLAQSGPPSHIPLSNTFIRAAETVIDDADRVEIKAPEVRFEAEMRDLKTAKDNLDHMAYEDQEHLIVGADSDLIFAISACHVQAKDGADTQKCEGQVKNARDRAMELLGHQKSGSSWEDGAPTH